MKESNEVFSRCTEEIGRFHSNIMKPRTKRLTFKFGGETIDAEFHLIRIEREMELIRKWEGREKHGPKECLELLAIQIGHAAEGTKQKLEHAIHQLEMGTLTHDDIRAIGGAVDKLIAASWPDDVPLPASFDEMLTYVSMYGGDHIAQRACSGLMTRWELLGVYSEIRLVKLEEAAIAAGASIQQARQHIRAVTPNRAERRRQEKANGKAKTNLQVVSLGTRKDTPAPEELPKREAPKGGYCADARDPSDNRPIGPDTRNA